MKIEASVNVKSEELAHLEKVHKKFIAEEEALRANPSKGFLRRGPTTTSYVGTPIREIDGQKVGQVGKVRIITDEMTPYKRMSLKDYRKMADQWNTQLKRQDA